MQDAIIAKFSGNSLLLMATANFVSLVLSAFASSLFASRFKRRLTFLKYWVIAGALLSIVFAFINLAEFTNILATAIIIGVYFGLGMPICMGYYAKTTEPQNRAKLSGIIILFIGIGYPVISIIGSNAPIFLAGTLAVWRILSLIFVLSIKPAEQQVESKEQVTYRSVISNKSFLLYATPWLMFSLINDLTMQLNTNYFSSSAFPQTFGQNFMLIENVLAGASAIICGILADRKGRKRLALIGFVLLGVGYASLGIFSANYLAAWFYVCVDGIAWGAFSMLFLVTIWGDIAQEKSGEKYYVLGVLPYLFSNLARVLTGTYISTNMEESTVFSFASFFLFIAILPIAFAPETLSDKIIKKLDLNSYVNKALEKAQKENTKNHRSKSESDVSQKHETSDDEADDTSAEYEEAKKLAEKYY
ncbi:MAG: MFS transporter [Chloroflexi bacterium]|nr:MFS transporter [Chloroflexota bacterium]